MFLVKADDVDADDEQRDDMIQSRDIPSTLYISRPLTCIIPESNNNP